MSYEADFEQYMKEEHDIETDGFVMPNEVEDEAIEQQEEVETPEEEVVDVAEEETEEEVTEEVSDEQDVEDNGEPEESEVKKYVFKANGEQYEATAEELLQLAPKAMDYTNKTKRLAKHRPVIEMIEEAGYSQEDVKMMFDAFSGNKEAFAMMADKAKIDPLDIDGRGNYVPTVESVDYELKDVVQSIRNDSQYGTTTNNYLTKLPDNVQSYMADNPQVLNGFHEEVQLGRANKVMPEVIKRLTINPNLDFLQTYQEVGASIFSNETESNKPERTRPPEGVKKAVTKKKKSSQPLKTKQVLDAFASDDDFAKLDAMIRSGKYKG